MIAVATKVNPMLKHKPVQVLNFILNFYDLKNFFGWVKMNCIAFDHGLILTLFFVDRTGFLFSYLIVTLITLGFNFFYHWKLGLNFYVFVFLNLLCYYLSELFYTF